MTWSRTFGDYGSKVTVFERTPGGTIHARWGNPQEVKSLGHKSKTRARRWALNKSEEIAAGASGEDVTLNRLLSLYMEHRSPEKSEREQRADTRRERMWRGYCEGIRYPHDLTLYHWNEFIRRRGGGSLSPNGTYCTEPSPVSSRTVEADCRWLNAVFNWGAKWRVNGAYVLKDNPIRGYPIPKERNPRQPVASEEWYRKVLEFVDSPLHEILVLANGTGRRLSAILQLRWADLRLEVPPYGAIVWPEDTDKEGVRRASPLPQEARVAIELLAVDGDDPKYLFPAVKSDGPMSRHYADKLLRKACKKAGVKCLGFHALRRKWASERMGKPGAAAAGGWANARTMELCYQHADWDTMLDAVLNPKPWNGVKE